ncbi:MAG: type II secretion system protein [Candidatus Rokubacteria bacterium]|nr:type II secretion system protein [Candidatus Rokubacteria bacterium]
MPLPAGLQGWRQAETGLTLVEIGIALAILAVGLTAFLSTFPVAFDGIQAARQSSTAVFLAVQRLEEVKAFAVSSDPARGLANVTAASFPTEPYDSITGYARYRREVTILDTGADPADARSVKVTVFYRASPAGIAVGETAVSLATLIASR